MAGYLSKTREKVEALVRAGQLEGVEPERVEVVSLFIFVFG
jgi:transcription initiation factor TFIIH subunit 1